MELKQQIIQLEQFLETRIAAITEAQTRFEAALLERGRAERELRTNTERLEQLVKEYQTCASQSGWLFVTPTIPGSFGRMKRWQFNPILSATRLPRQIDLMGSAQFY